MHYYVYILTNKKHGTLYTGMTNDLVRRIIEHKSKLVPGFTKEHNLTKLVYYEKYDLVKDAIHREKLIKKYKRQWKYNLVEENNPNWEDLTGRSNFVLQKYE